MDKEQERGLLQRVHSGGRQECKAAIQEQNSKRQNGRQNDVVGQIGGNHESGDTRLGELFFPMQRK
ncbi:MAG: hypothetical protein LBE16_00720 [Clostridiales Family XIII bacterium]|jgi:hypothetical protein|nr:hypothetical protein [Clostridiales Family XIII bacterium]